MRFVPATLAAFAVIMATHLAEGTILSTTAEGTEFFEKHIRPVLSERCWTCHGAKKQESGLRLDSMRGLLAGGELLGPILDVTNSQQSLILEVINYENDIQMPPDERLSDQHIEAIRQWVAMGAPWPSDGRPTGTLPANPVGAWKSHWAAQPIQSQLLPPVEQTNWPHSPIDFFILRELEDRELQPSPPADRSVLIRRASYDLIGLPPTLEEIDNFQNDMSPDAFVRVVDRLLASPYYGERWGRYWLDLARYADTKGYVRLQEEPSYHYAYTYRDYVVRAFNEDLPYDQFLIEQLAADQIEMGDDNRALTALGFLTLGRRFTGNKHDIIDDRIDVVTRGLLALTVTCARCHDHKYDPIPIADYYSLYGLFASAREPEDLPLIGEKKTKPVFYGDMNDYSKKRQQLDDLQHTKHTEMLNALRADTSRYLARVLEGRKPFLVPLPAESTEVRHTFVEFWIDYIQGSSRRSDPVFKPWRLLAGLQPDEFAEKARWVIEKLSRSGSNDSEENRCNHLVLQALTRHPPASMAEVAHLYGELLADAHHQWQSHLSEEPQATAWADKTREELRQVLYGPDSPFSITPKDAVAAYLYDAEINKELAEAQLSFDAWLIKTGQAPDRAHILIDTPSPYQSNVFIRGNPARPGPLVPTHFLGMLSEEPRRPFEHGKARLQLAHAIVDTHNPLTARVLVNRIWSYHFGAPIVITPSNFGLSGERPSHPVLLTHLARQFMDGGWSIKKLHRSIMLSSTYQQASYDRPECREEDPDNRLCWKMNRRRLDFEVLRDSLLWAADRLDMAIGGPTAPLIDSTNTRRTIYGTIDRLDLPKVLPTFDFSSPDAHIPKRSFTIVPQQALFLMNNPFVLKQAQALSRRTRGQGELDPTEKIVDLYLLTLGRRPTEKQATDALEFIQDDQSWEELAQALLLSNQFLFVD